MMRSKLFASVCMAACLMFGAVAYAQDATPEATAGPLTLGDVTGGNAANYYGQTVTVDGNVDELVNIRSFLLGGGGLNNPQVLVLNNSGHEFDIGLSTDANVRVTGTIYPSYNQGGWDQVSAIAVTGPAMPGMDTSMGMDTMSGMNTAGMDTMIPTVDTTGMDTTMMTEMPMATEMSGMDTMIPTVDTTGMDTTMMTEMPMATEMSGMDTMSSGMDTLTAGMSQWVGLDQYPISILTNRFSDYTILVINSVDAIEYLPNPSAGVTATPSVGG